MSRYNQVGSHKTTIQNIEGVLTVTYHETPVVKAGIDTIVLNTGGWKTNTTKTRMNQASNQFDLGFGVYQRKGEWYCDFKNETIPFTNDVLTLAK